MAHCKWFKVKWSIFNHWQSPFISTKQMRILRSLASNLHKLPSRFPYWNEPIDYFNNILFGITWCCRLYFPKIVSDIPRTGVYIDDLRIIIFYINVHMLRYMVEKNTHLVNQVNAISTNSISDTKFRYWILFFSKSITS